MFRFTIREFLLLTVVVAMGVAWWLDRSHLAADVARYKEPLMKLRRMGFDVGVLLKAPELTEELNAEWEAENAKRATKVGWMKLW